MRDARLTASCRAVQPLRHLQSLCRRGDSVLAACGVACCTFFRICPARPQAPRSRWADVSGVPDDALEGADASRRGASAARQASEAEGAFQKRSGAEIQRVRAGEAPLDELVEELSDVGPAEARSDAEAPPAKRPTTSESRPYLAPHR